MNLRLNKTGFSLLEVMIAISILAISLIILIDFQGDSMIVTSRAERINVSTMLARQRMADFEIEYEKNMKKNQFPEEKSEEGKFEEPYDDYAWNLTIKKVEIPMPKLGEENAMAQVMQMISKQISDSPFFNIFSQSIIQE